MPLISKPEDRINVLRSVIAPVIFFAPFCVGFPDGYEIFTVVLIYITIGDTNYLLHLHVHRPFGNNRVFNVILDLLLASVTGMTASNWRIQHVHGHHRGKDVLFRGSTDWELEKYTAGRAASFCFRSVWPTFWYPFLQSFKRGVMRNIKTPINFRWAFVEHALLLVLIFILLMVNARLVLCYLLPMYVLTYFITRYVDYLNHYGCDETSEDVYRHANNCLNSWFNRLTHNFGYHTAHHIRPSVHWSKLPDVHHQIADQIPQSCKKSFSWSWLLLPYHFYLGSRDRM